MSAELPRLYTAKEIADALRGTEWWVKERARLREIPFVFVGGAYRFTEQHLAEIVALFENRPEQTSRPTVAAPRRRAQPRPQPGNTEVFPLQARQPKRRPKAG